MQDLLQEPPLLQQTQENRSDKFHKRRAKEAGKSDSDSESESETDEDTMRDETSEDETDEDEIELDETSEDETDEYMDETGYESDEDED
jgi:hypothetical protein